MAGKGQKFKKIPLEKRLEAVTEMMDKGKSINYIGKKYGVSRKTAYNWKKIYLRDGGLDVRRKGRPKKEEIDYKERYEILKKFQAFLKEVDREKK